MLKVLDKSYIVFVLLLVAGCLIFYHSQKLLPTTDAQRYVVLTQNLISGKGFALGQHPELIYPPGYSIALVPFLIYGLSSDLSLALLSSLSFILMNLFLFVFLKKVFDKNIAFIVFIFVLINGNIIFWTLVGMSEPLWLAGMFSSAYLFLLNNRKEKIISGLVAGYSYLLKPETLGYVVLIIIILYFLKRINVKSFVFFVLPFLGIVFLYSIWIFSHSGVWSFSGKTATIYLDSYIENKTITRDELAGRLNNDGSVGINLKYISEDKPNLADRLIYNIHDFKRALFELFLPLKFIVVSGMFTLFLLKKVRKLFIYLIILTTPTLSSLLFHIENRYLVTILIAGIVFLSYSMVAFSYGKSFMNKIMVVIIFCALGLLSYYSFLPLRFEYQELVRKKAEVIEFIESFNSDKRLILSRKPVYSYYSEKDFYQLPYTGDVEGIREYLSKKSDYIIILDRWSSDTIPLTHALISENYIDLGLKVIKYDNNDKIVFEKR